MKKFVELAEKLDQTTKTNLKVRALKHYFDEAEESDKLWAIAVLSHRRPKRPVNTTLLKEWAAERSGLPTWLFEETYHVVGDLAETVANILPAPGHQQEDQGLAQVIAQLKAMRDMEEPEKKTVVLKQWDSLPITERFIFNKLITGGFRLGVSQKLMVRALSQHSGIEENVLAHRLMGDWEPDNTSYRQLVLEGNDSEDLSRPYPFYLAYGLEDEPEALGAIAEWQAERKWDGIRGQLIVRQHELFIWSRGEELVTDRFPELAELISALPDGTVIDGEILAYKDGRPLPFQQLQTRIGRKTIGKKLLKDSPVVIVAYDLLEFEGKDIREEPMSHRRTLLENLISTLDEEAPLKISPLVQAADWSGLRRERENSRAHQSEGLMLKRKDAPYGVGRKKGDWWKWKVDPFSIDAVMIYAMRGHGRRANLYTDYTFAVWKGEELVPFAKAYSGLTDKEIAQVDQFVKKNTLDRFGPVRSVKAELVFELAFEGIQKSTRHKSGVALRFPRIKRWRQDKPASEANTYQDLLDMLAQYGNG